MNNEQINKPSYRLEKNPKVDVLIRIYDLPPVPTKQDAYKPLNAWQVNKDGTEQILNNIYSRKPNNNTIKDFHTLLSKIAKEHFPEGQIFKKPSHVEVIISISVTEKRFKSVDVDNLAKTVLDGLNNIAFEDDSQVVSLICNKHIHPTKKNGILIGITKLTNENQGFIGDITLYNMIPNDDLLRLMNPIIEKLKKANR
ncbi:RusA family crossover junction endodeoxyribonuclease [Pedobacter arcticus]|uniref:RusA family crossover junction endodeoxyribonuclease n=1 Tax=Pedobacter arcticus TaxID=752140 RepID=UPI0002E7B519|nr:RusA family crossover junction endodeoxyribonuclease [Pedobacter arcticus]